MVAFVFLFGLLYMTTVASVAEVKESRNSIDDVRAKYLAEAGVERALHFLGTAVNNTAGTDPLDGLSGLFDAGVMITPFVGEPVLDGQAQVGAYSVSVTRLVETADSITIGIEVSGYLPAAPADLAPGEELESWHALSVAVQYNIEPSDVFDYAYFINNWGWFYGSTIVCNGNARSNGQFDVAGYSPTVTGQPMYDDVSWNGSTASLSGYHDDNEDGLMDGNDGGIFSSWDIVDAQNVQGNGGLSQNQHDFDDPIEMPNLSDLTRYKTEAIANGSSISIGGVEMSNGVYGDEPGERQNLYLNGTLADPIVLNGKVVVEGDVIISGYVTGQGALYSDGNIYVPDSVKYVDPPSSVRPAGNTQAETEAWLSDNWNKDFLGLFAKENIVVGDHTHWLWQLFVNNWMGSSLNRSDEDAGADGIPNTYAGRDGIVGTADDDVLEDDGVFSAEYYTDEDDTLDLIPPGLDVGDVIPGSGEDIDGDGVYDSATTLADVILTTPLNSGQFGGNMPQGGIGDYGDIATLYANQLDAVFYTNHSFCYLVLGSDDAQINGAIVSRNENIIYGTPTIQINHDSRLLGGAAGIGGSLLPRVMQAPVVVAWQRLQRDPNRYLPTP